MHVVYLIDSLIAGGAERSLAALAPQYARVGIRLEVAFLYERDNVWRPAIETAGAPVHSLAGSGGRVAAVRRVAALLRDRRPDLLHTTLFDADVIGRTAATLARVRVVTSLVNAAYGPEQLADPAVKRWKLRAAQALDAVSARKVTRFHAVSTSVADTLAPRLRIARDRIEVIPRGRDASELGERTAARRDAARAALGLSAAERLVLAVGRHEFQKGFDVLTRAFARVRAAHPEARLVVAGRPGAGTTELRSLIAQLDVARAVDLLGFRADVADLLCAADVFVSASRWEGSPGGVLEAMALAAPIVATDIAPVREVLGDASGARLVPVDDVGALATAIFDALGDRSEGTAGTAALRARFLEHYTIERVADRMREFYERALA